MHQILLCMKAHTIKITNSDNILAKNLLNYLKSLAEDKEYDFLQIIEEEESFSEEINQEMNDRYEHYLKHHNEYEDWESIKNKFIKK